MAHLLKGLGCLAYMNDPAIGRNMGKSLLLVTTVTVTHRCRSPSQPSTTAHCNLPPQSTTAATNTHQDNPSLLTTTHYDHHYPPLLLTTLTTTTTTTFHPCLPPLLTATHRDHHCSLLAHYCRSPHPPILLLTSYLLLPNTALHYHPVVDL